MPLLTAFQRPIPGAGHHRCSRDTFARRSAAPLATALLATALFAVPAQAQQQAPQGQAPAGQGPALVTFGDWVQRCTPTPPEEASPPREGEQEACFVTQQLVNQNNQQPVLKITVGYFKPNRRPGAVFAMPLGIPLAGGVQIGVDGKGVVGVPFQICRRDGCQAFLPLTEGVLAAFKAGNQGVVQLKAGQNAEPINLPFSLSGFTAGFNSLQ